ncbi:helix-turn-helix domain-containing protein [Streptomyces albofaciens]|uniref:helix-turn-helix domain-containing protein n=1 Tax=Streptomyces albofaciens TaxID=66866 RepID=UPI001FCB19D6|nr:XRE family transcriptional regulator [Streptomyces albofaciens]
MTREARSRLNRLRRDDPPAARLVGEAVTGLLAEGLRLGPPLVVPVGAALRAGEPREALDYWYRRQLALLMKVRRAVADVKASRQQLDRQIGELGRQARRLAELGARAAGSGRADLAEEAEERRTAVRRGQALLGESSAGVREREADLVGISRRVQNQVDLFLARRRGVEAVQQAGRVQQDVHDALAELDGAPGAESAAARAAADSTVAAARGEARDMADGAERLEHEVRVPLGVRPPAMELYELRLAALTGRDLRVLCTVEAAPSGGRAEAVVLLAVGADRAQWWDWYEYALPLARERLARRERRGRQPGAEDAEFVGGRDCFRDWYPGTEEERHSGAARLTARNRGQRLASVRRRRGLTQRQLAGLMGVPVARVAALERAEPGAVEIRVLAAYVTALGGRLEVIADFDTERLVLG